MRRRAPRELSSALDELTATLAPPGLLSEVQRVWRDAVGEAIANEATPIGEHDATVTVACSSSAWSQELELLGPTLVTAVNRHLHADRVAALRCRVGRR